MFLSPSDGLIGSPPVQNASQAGAVGPDGLLHALTLDAAGNLLTTTPGGPTAANQQSEIGKLTSIAASLAGTLATTSEAVAAVKAGTGFRATTSPVQVGPASVLNAVLPTAPVAVALFQNPAASTKTVTIDVRSLTSNVSGVFTITRDPNVTATGSSAVTPVNLLASSSTAPAATLYQAGGSTALAATGGKIEAVVSMGAVGIDREPVMGREILPPGHSLLISFLPYVLLSYAGTAAAAFDWREA